jgi:hypothetical protein
MRRALLAALLVAACAPAPPPERPAPYLLPEAADASLPPGFEILGGACPQGEQALTPVQYKCNADGRVARVYTLVQQHDFGGEGARGLPSMPAGSARLEGVYGSPARVFVGGDRLWVATTCGPCRVPSEELWIVDLPLAVDEDLARLQSTLGLPESPVLRTAAAWRKAVDERRAAR